MNIRDRGCNSSKPNGDLPLGMAVGRKSHYVLDRGDQTVTAQQGRCIERGRSQFSPDF